MNDYLDEEFHDFDPPTDDPVAVDTSGAIRAARALQWAESEIRRIDETAALERAKINDWQERASRRAAAISQWANSTLTLTALTLRAQNPNNKTLHLPGFIVSTTHRPEAIEVTDPEAVVEWANLNDHEEWVSWKSSPNMRTIRDRLTAVDEKIIDPETGAVMEIPGITVKPARLAVSVRAVKTGEVKDDDH